MDILATAFFFASSKALNSALQQRQQAVLSICNSILQNLSAHPKNRSQLFEWLSSKWFYLPKKRNYMYLKILSSSPFDMQERDMLHH
jgi:hypothetical protein